MSGGSGVTDALVRNCNLSGDELAQILKRRGQEVVYWTTEADGGLLDFWVEDEEEEFHGPFACTAVEERSDGYTLQETHLRLAAVERLLASYHDWHARESNERHAAEVALRKVESELRNDLARAKTKRGFLETAGRGGVERLAGMEEAFQIALNRIQRHKPS